MSEGKDSNPENTPVTKPEPDKDLDAMDVVDEFLARSEYALGRGWRHFKQGVFVTKKHIKRRYRRLTMPEHSSIKHSWVVKKAGHTVPKAGVSEPLPRKLHKHKKKLGKSRLYIKQRRTLPRFRLIALLIIIGVILLFIPWGYHHTITLHTDALDAKNCSTSSGSFCIKSWQGKLPMIAGKATLEFKPPVDLTTVRTTLKINATGDDPIYVNNKLFWNPAWDSYVKVASFKGSRLFKPEGSMANPAISPEDSSAGNDSASKGGGSSGWLQRLGWGRINNQEQTNNDQKLKTNNPDIDIYVSPEYANRTSTLKEAKTLEEWLEKNAKFDSVYFLGVNFTNPINPDAGEGFKKRSWTTINTTLRDTHQFYVYLKDSFNMTMGKRDWNSYMGKDEFRVSLIEVETNKLVFSKVFEDDDDGNKSALKRDPTQIKEFYTDNIKEGVYLLNIEFIMGENDYSDSYIDFIKINTDRIVTFDHLLPIGESAVYTENPSENKIRLYYWHTNKDQAVSVSGDENRIINLTKADNGRTVYAALQGKSTLHFPKGDLHINADMYFSFSEESYFIPFLYYEQSYKPNVLIVNKEEMQVDTNKNRFAFNSNNASVSSISLNFDNNFRRINVFYILVLGSAIFIFSPLLKKRRVISPAQSSLMCIDTEESTDKKEATSDEDFWKEMGL